MDGIINIRKIYEKKKIISLYELDDEKAKEYIIKMYNYIYNNDNNNEYNFNITKDMRETYECIFNYIFNNTKKIMWVSAGPYQIGKYIPYSLPDVFDRGVTKKYTTQFDPKYIIDSDSFIYTDEYRKFEEYKLIKSKIKAAIKDKTNQQFSNKTEQDIFIQSNKNYYNTYVLLGDYEASRMNYNKALEYYNKSLTRIIPSKSELESIQRKIENSKK